MDFYSMTAQQTAEFFGTDPKTGLSHKTAEENIHKYGSNIIENKKKNSILKKFLEQFNDFMIIILLIAAAISFITAMADNGDITDAVIIFAIVILNAVIGVVQEQKAEKAIEALKKISAPTAFVRRGGREYTIPADKVTVGDILILRAGDIAPADARIISANNFCCNESALTGESSDSVKNTAPLSGKQPLADRINMVYSSSSITMGNAEAIVCAVGRDTEVGKIADFIMNTDDRRTPLQEKLANTGKVLAISALAICVVIFLIGLYKGIPPFDMFITAVSLAVAAIPESMTAIVTVMLAMGVKRMAKCGAVVRHLPSVETLGSADVICSDKTGTLTQNKMRVVSVYSHDDIRTLKYAGICTDASENGSRNPTENAIISAAADIGEKKARLDKEYIRISEIPFDSERKYMNVLCRHNGRYITIVKGAPDILIKKCNKYFDGTKECPLSSEIIKNIRIKNDEQAMGGLRVIAVAYFCGGDKIKENDFVFLGLIGIEDPPRKEAESAIKLCKKAGIRAVMITGDQKPTAQKIAGDVGIGNKTALTGSELDAMSDSEFNSCLDNCSVFARVTPEHKMRIVKGFQKKGKIVAVTGDGVNDAPALKTADIGCAMGISGTEVSRASADMVLTDDNFATIVEAVKQGRGIFDNIHKSVKFLLSSNIGEILTIFLGLIFGTVSPLCAVQLLWVNLVTDSLPAVALGVNRIDDDVMNGKRENLNKGLFSLENGISICIEGCMIGALAIFAFVIGKTMFNDMAVASTMAFCVLSLSQLVHSFNMQSEKSIFKSGVFKNKYLVLSAVIGAALQVSAVVVPAMSSVFKTSPLTSVQWAVTAVLSFMPLLLVELEKAVNSKKGI